MIRHRGPISGVSAFGDFVATAGYDNQVILWDRLTKTAVARGFHDHLVNRCEFSRDGKYLVSASSDYTARLWELPEMKLTAVFGGHTDDVEMVRFSPCGQMVATVSQDGIVRIFSLDGGLLRSMAGHQGQTSACAWSNDGRTLVSSGDDGTIRTWDVQSGRQLKVIQPENVQTDAVAMVASGLVFAGNDAGELIRLDGEKMERLAIHSAGVKNLAVSPDGRYVATMSYDRDLALIDVSEGLSIVRKIKIPAVIWARACVFQDTDTLLFGTFGSSYASFNLKTNVWDFSNLEETDCLNAVISVSDSLYAIGDSGIVRKIKSESVDSVSLPRESIASVGSLCNFMATYNERLVTGGHLGKVFDAKSGDELISIGSPINKALQAKGYLVLATYVGSLCVVREEDDKSFSMVGEYKVLTNAVKDLCFDGRFVFCAGAARDIAVFDLEGMERKAYRENAHDNIVNSCTCLGPQMFATVSRDLSLRIWNGVELVEKIQTPHNHSIKCAAASTDGQLIATCSYDGKIAVYNRTNGRWVMHKKLTAAGISSVIYANEMFYASSYDGNIYGVKV